VLGQYLGRGAHHRAVTPGVDFGPGRKRRGRYEERRHKIDLIFRLAPILCTSLLARHRDNVAGQASFDEIVRESQGKSFIIDHKRQECAKAIRTNFTLR